MSIDKEETKQAVREVMRSYEDPTPLANGKMALNVNVSAVIADDVNVTEIGGSAIALGQTTMASSLPVVLSSDQSEIPVAIASTASTANQPSLFRSLTVDSTPQVIKSSPGNVYGWNIINKIASTIYVKIYNKAAAAVNPAVDTPIRTLVVYANGDVLEPPACVQRACTTAISVRCVTGIADTDTTSPATPPIIEIDYL